MDILTGVLAGGPAAPLIAPLFSPDHGSSDLGQLFITIDPEAIDEPGAFQARLAAELDLFTQARTAPGAPGRILVPGEPEAQAERRSDERGVAIDAQHHADLLALAEQAALPFPETTPIGG